MDDMWTPREKKLAALAAVLAVALIGILVADWWGGAEEPVPVEAYPPESAAQPADASAERRTCPAQASPPAESSTRRRMRASTRSMTSSGVEVPPVSPTTSAASNHSDRSSPSVCT